MKSEQFKAAAPNFLAGGVGQEWRTQRETGGRAQVVTQEKLHSLACCSHPAVQPGSQQATDWYWSVAWGLGTPGLRDQQDMVKWVNRCIREVPEGEERKCLRTYLKTQQPKLLKSEDINGYTNPRSLQTPTMINSNRSNRSNRSYIQTHYNPITESQKQKQES